MWSVFACWECVSACACREFKSVQFLAQTVEYSGFVFVSQSCSCRSVELKHLQVDGLLIRQCFRLRPNHFKAKKNLKRSPFQLLHHEGQYVIEGLLKWKIVQNDSKLVQNDFKLIHNYRKIVQNDMKIVLNELKTIPKMQKWSKNDKKRSKLTKNLLKMTQKLSVSTYNWGTFGI